MKSYIIVAASAVFLAVSIGTCFILSRNKVRVLEHTQYDDLIHNLQEWVESICFLQQTDDTFDGSRYQSANELFGNLLNRLPPIFVLNKERESWNDAWGHPFLLTHKETPETKIVRILSKGRQWRLGSDLRHAQPQATATNKRMKSPAWSGWRPRYEQTKKRTKSPARSEAGGGITK